MGASQRLVASCQINFGSRKPLALMSRTGLPVYFVHVRPRSTLKAIDCACHALAPSMHGSVYATTSGGSLPSPKPDVLLQSTTALPEQIRCPYPPTTPPTLGIAIGSCRQCTRSVLTAWP